METHNLKTETHKLEHAVESTLELLIYNFWGQEKNNKETYDVAEEITKVVIQAYDSWLIEENKDLYNICNKQDDEIERLRKALRFYKNEKAYYCDLTHPSTQGRCIMDGGAVARAALGDTHNDET